MNHKQPPTSWRYWQNAIAWQSDCVTPATPLKEALAQLHNKAQAPNCLIVQADQAPYSIVGLLTHPAVGQWLLEGHGLDEASVAAVMIPPQQVLHSGQSPTWADWRSLQQHFQQAGDGWLPVIDDRTQRVGVLTAARVLAQVGSFEAAHREADTVAPSASAAMPSAVPSWEAIATMAPAVIYLYDQQLQRHIYANQQAERVLGYDLEAIQQPEFVPQVLHPDDFPNLAAHLERLRGMPEGTTLGIEYRMRHANGAWRWFYSEDTVFKRDADGQVGQILGVAQDITQRKQSELAKQRMLQDLSGFKAVLDHAAIVAMTDAQGIITYVNTRFCEVSGYSKEELIGQTHRVVKSDTHPGEFFAELWQTITTGQIWQGEICNQRKNGQLYWVETTIMPLLDAQGQPRQYLAVRFDITQRKQAEMQLRSLSERLALALQVANTGTWEWDLQDRVRWDDQMYDLYGVRSRTEPITFHTWQHHVHPDDITAAETALHQALQTGTDFDVEFRIVRADDHAERWLHARGQLQWNAEGQAIAMMGINRDITPRKQAETQINQLLAAIEAAVDGIALLRGGQYIYLNRAHVEMFGYTQPDELLGQSWELLYSPAELDRFAQEVLPDLMRDRAWQGEAIATRRDGSTFAEGLSLTLTAEDLLICVCRDVTPRKQAEAEIEANRAYFESIVADQTELICRFDSDGILTFVNDAYCDFFQLTRAELLGQRFVPLLPEADRNIPYEHFSQLSYENPIVTYSHRVIAPDGSIRWQQWSDRALFDSDGNLIEYQAVGRDITVLKEATQQLQRSNEELARATRMKDEFLANMSHELRTPLNAILGMAEGLQEEVFGPVSQGQSKALQTIERSGSHLLSLINDILDVAKIESGQIELDYSAVTVHQLCESSLAFVKQQALKKRLRLALQVPPGLPALCVDERRMRQVLINLLTNAVKFTPEGGQITLAATLLSPAAAATRSPDPQQRYPSRLQISVTDTGIGISPENAQRLFQPFIQVDSALNRQHEGTGLGLALVKRIVDLHGGCVTLDSEVGRGSCFKVELPATIAAPSPPRPNAVWMNADLASSAADRPPLILLVEDNEANILTIGGYLEARGYRLVIATDGAAAIAQAQAEPPDLILMDIQMPGMDGLEAIRQLRLQAAFADVPIIALTALAMETDRDRCLAAGANEYLSKPVRLKQLLETRRSLLLASEQA